ncbi:glycosyltransferase, partial [Lacticaseibacillus rhamnosus]
MGRPVIVTDITGCRETVKEGVTGHMFPVGDAPALAARIIEVLDDPERARALGQAGRKLAEERFDERVVFRIVADTYRELLAKKGIAAPAPRVERAPARGGMRRHELAQRPRADRRRERAGADKAIEHRTTSGMRVRCHGTVCDGRPLRDAADQLERRARDDSSRLPD